MLTSQRFLCSQCHFTKMIIFAPSRNKTKFVVKIKFFTSHFLISFTDDIKKMLIFSETCCAHIECQDVHANFVFNFFQNLKMFSKTLSIFILDQLWIFTLLYILTWTLITSWNTYRTSIMHIREHWYRSGFYTWLNRYIAHGWLNHLHKGVCHGTRKRT
jgi:hypothetical protein